MNLLSMLRRSRAYATGGTCDGERWQAAGRLEAAALSTETQETCTQVNLEQLAKRALGWSDPAAAADWADYAVGPGRYCSSRHPTHLTSCLLSRTTSYAVVSNICQTLLRGAGGASRGAQRSARSGRAALHHAARSGRVVIENKHSSGVESPPRFTGRLSHHSP